MLKAFSVIVTIIRIQMPHSSNLLEVKDELEEVIHGDDLSGDILGSNILCHHARNELFKRLGAS